MPGPRTSGGLCDLQVNGFAGVDFNDDALTAEALDVALAAILRTGVTHCLPTLITASPEVLLARLGALDAAVRGSRLGPVMVPGYHIEGPFLNDTPGYAGCHPAEAMADPDPALYDRLSAGRFRPVLLVTLAPERDGALALARRLTASGCTVGLGHTAAGFAQVRAAAEAGATLSTHLGNGLPQTLPKLENTLLAQLAEPGLAACLIADGHHIPPEALAALIRLKGAERVILVTDAVLAAAAPQGTYNFAGMQIERTAEGAMVQPGRSNLAGSALCLDQAVRNVVAWGIAGADQAIGWAGTAPRAALARSLAAHGLRLDPGRVEWSEKLAPLSVTPGRVLA
jgi:N-acetylglucosamine-6-phosphate deacetylase